MGIVTPPPVISNGPSLNRLNSDQRRKCACAARWFRAERRVEPKRGFELVVPRRLSLQWLILGGPSSRVGKKRRPKTSLPKT